MPAGSPRSGRKIPNTPGSSVAVEDTRGTVGFDRVERPAGLDARLMTPEGVIAGQKAWPHGVLHWSRRRASTSRPCVKGREARTAAATLRQRTHQYSKTAAKPQNQSARNRAGSRPAVAGAGAEAAGKTAS